MIEPDSTNHRGVTPHNEEINDGEILYACPACGAVVSNHDPAAMRLHHLHVVTSASADRTVEGFIERMEAERAQNERHKEKQTQWGDAPSFALSGS